MHHLLRPPALAALVAATAAVPSLHAQDPHAALDRLHELALDSIVASSTVYFRSADRERARVLQSMLDEYLEYWNSRLGLNAHLRVAVLSPDDWKQMTPLPYGFPTNFGPPADLILAASAPPPPTDLDTLLVDGARDGRDWLLIGHEGGHLLHWALLPSNVLAFLNDQTHTDTAALTQLRRVDGIPKWFWEYSASYFLTAFLEARHPATATAWTRYLDAFSRPPAPRYAHLDDWFGEFMRATASDGAPYFLSAEGGTNFGWYQGVAGMLGAHVIAQDGDGVAYIRRVITADDDAPTTAALLAELESIAPGTIALLDRLAVGYRERDQPPPSSETTADCDCDAAAANVRLVRLSVELGYNARNPEFFDSAYHPDAVVWNNGVLLDDGPILDGFRGDLVAYDQIFSEWRIEVDDIFGTADRVAVRWTFHGRLLNGDRDVTQTGNWIGRFDNGKIVEVWEATQEPGAPRSQAPGDAEPPSRLDRQPVRHHEWHKAS